jgi:hypothetical protein
MATAHKTFEDVKKEGEWNLHVYKSRATRWDWTLHSIHGGSGGMSSYTSIKSAVAAATRNTDWEGKSQVWIILSKWDPSAINAAGEEGDYVVTKTYWMDVTFND